MFICQSWTFRIEPKYLPLFPHKITLFHFFDPNWTHGYLYTPPGHPVLLLSFHLRRVLSSCMMPYGIRDFKIGSTTTFRGHVQS